MAARSSSVIAVGFRQGGNGGGDHAQGGARWQRSGVATRPYGGPRASRWCERPVWTWRSGELFGPISRFDDINLERFIDVPEATKAEVDETILFGRTDRAPRARRDTDRTWRRFRLQSGGDVHAVPEDIRPTGHHMAYVYAHPQQESAKRHRVLALVDGRLDGN